MKIVNIMIAALYRSLQERYEDYDKSCIVFLQPNLAL